MVGHVREPLVYEQKWLPDASFSVKNACRACTNLWFLYRNARRCVVAWHFLTENHGVAALFIAILKGLGAAKSTDSLPQSSAPACRLGFRYGKCRRRIVFRIRNWVSNMQVFIDSEEIIYCRNTAYRCTCPYRTPWFKRAQNCTKSTTSYNMSLRETMCFAIEKALAPMVFD